MKEKDVKQSMKNNIVSNFIETMVETTFDKLRFIFSIEFAFTAVITLLLCKLPAINHWIWQPYTPDFSAGADAVLRHAAQRDSFEYLRFLIFFLLIIISVYGIGEIIRKKLKRKSLLFDQKKDSGSDHKK